MKKIISLLLVLVMVFSMTAFASAASNSFTDIYNSKNEDAIEFLYDLGLIEGYSVTKFGPKENLTRAEACALIVRALIEDDEIYADIKDTFVDVDYYTWYREWVDTAYRHDIMHGYGNAKFGPKDHVTYAQYATILVNALGYDSLNFEGTWPANVEELAIKLDLYDNVSRHVSNDEITREDAAQMLYNALWCKMVGMRGVTLYDVVTKEKVVTKTGNVIVTDVENGWVEFIYNGVQTYSCKLKDYNACAIVGHVDYVEISFNGDYSKVNSVYRISCVNSQMHKVIEGYVTGHIAYDNDNNIVNVEINGCDYAIASTAEWYDLTETNAKFGGVDTWVRLYQCDYPGCICYVEFYNREAEPTLNIVDIEDATYCVNTYTLKYHELDCVVIPNIKEKNREYVNNSLEELIQMGYTHCDKCYNDNGANDVNDDLMMVP